MSKFKIGVDVRVIGLSDLLHPGIKIGDVRTVTATCSNGVQLDGFSDGWVYDIHIETFKSKWSIYNNTLFWSQLNYKQKGKLLVADNNGIRFHCFSANARPKFNIGNEVYTAVEPNPIKPEPTMAEVLAKDILGCSGFLRPHDVDDLIAKGWTKTCK